MSSQAMRLLPTLFLLLLVVRSRQALATSVSGVPDGWTYVGCLYEGIGQRIMTEEFQGSDEMTNSMCIENCAKQGQPYAAIEVGYQCLCGSKLDIFQLADTSKCDNACHGDSSQPCGGYGYMTFFALSDKDPRESGSPVASSATVETSTVQSVQPLRTSQAVEASTASPSSSSLPESQNSDPSSSSTVEIVLPTLNSIVTPDPSASPDSSTSPRFHDAADFISFGRYASIAFRLDVYTCRGLLAAAGLLGIVSLISI